MLPRPPSVMNLVMLLDYCMSLLASLQLRIATIHVTNMSQIISQETCAFTCCEWLFIDLTLTDFLCLVSHSCNDTVPEPKNWACSTVPPYDDDHKDICDEHRNEWESINFHNLMGYARDQKCRNTFTPQQIWRMRCSVDKFIGERAGKA